MTYKSAAALHSVHSKMNADSSESRTCSTALQSVDVLPVPNAPRTRKGYFFSRVASDAMRSMHSRCLVLGGVRKAFTSSVDGEATAAPSGHTNERLTLSIAACIRRN
eukprot:2709773-Prymnesium_polylepis.3